MKTILIFAALTSLSAHAGYAELPFDPAYAADQKEITFDSLGGEIGQFQQMNTWHNMLGNIKNKKVETEQLRKAYERGKTLVGTGAITREEFERREFAYKISAGTVKEMESRAQMLRISVESTKLGIIMKGDSTKDLRMDTAQKMKESLEAQLEALKYSSENAALVEAYTAKQEANARELFNKKVIGEVELDRRAAEHENAATEVETLSHQVDVIKKAVAGLDRSLQRLFGQH